MAVTATAVVIAGVEVASGAAALVETLVLYTYNHTNSYVKKCIQQVLMMTDLDLDS